MISCKRQFWYFPGGDFNIRLLIGKSFMVAQWHPRFLFCHCWGLNTSTIDLVWTRDVQKLILCFEIGLLCPQYIIDIVIIVVYNWREWNQEDRMKGYGAIKIKNKKVNNLGIDGKVFNCRNQLFDNFCHKRSLEVTGGQ